MKCCGQFWSLADAIESAQAELAALRGQVGRELTVEDYDENAPLRNMAPLAVRVPRLPVRRPETEARPALRAAYDTP